MVKFAQSISPMRLDSSSLAEMIRANLACFENDLREMRIELEIDVDPLVAACRCQPALPICLRQLLQAAIARCQPDGELSISACRTIRGVEIEIADSGQASDDDVPANAFSRCGPATSTHSRSNYNQLFDPQGLEFYHTRCPLGGQAWTIVMTSRVALVRAA